MAFDASREERFTRDRAAGDRGSTPRRTRAHEKNEGLYWLFVIPLIATLFPMIYNTNSPELFGIPFFYWYQMLWVPITVILTVIVYLATRGER